MGKFGFNPTRFIHWNEQTQLKTKEKYKTEYIKRSAAQVPQNREKYSTAPIASKDKPKNDNCSCHHCNKDTQSQNDYMKRHLYIKSCVDNETSAPWRFQAQKVSIRNYTPKAINQELNMGMWM